MAQLVCTNPQCTVVLMYPRGANQVQCSVCGHVNDAMAVSPPTGTSIQNGRAAGMIIQLHESSCVRDRCWFQQ